VSGVTASGKMTTPLPLERRSPAATAPISQWRKSGRLPGRLRERRSRHLTPSAMAGTSVPAATPRGCNDHGSDAIVWREPASTRCPDVARNCGTIVGQRPARMRMRDSTGTRVTLLNSFRSGSAGLMTVALSQLSEASDNRIREKEKNDDRGLSVLPPVGARALLCKIRLGVCVAGI
jgi:hypothetical protein